MPKSNLIVRCGDWNVQGNEELQQHQDRTIADVIIHPLYSGRGTNANDQVHNNFAVLHMDQEFDMMSDHISHVCLPEIPNQRTGIYRPYTSWITLQKYEVYA